MCIVILSYQTKPNNNLNNNNNNNLNNNNNNNRNFPRDLRYSDEPEVASDGSAFCPTTIFIGDLSENIDERELQRVFSRYGRVECIRLIPGKTYANTTNTTTHQ
jgi:RNA recognition motif-containing protein